MEIESLDCAVARGVFEAAPDALILVGVDGGITLVNPRAEALFQQGREALVGRNLQQLLSSLGFAPLADEGPSGDGLEVLRREGNGDRAVYLELSRSPLVIAQESFTVVAARDVTLRHRRWGHNASIAAAVSVREDVTVANERERIRGEWITVVAHDLRHPVAAIMLFARCLENSVHDDAGREFLSKIIAGARTLDRMVADLLDLSQAEVRQLPLWRKRSDITALAREAMARLEGEATQRPLRFEVRGELPALSVDPDRIAQVMDNLLTNALKYGADGTPITVSIEPREGFVVVSVTSEGPGIAPDEIPRLFQRFRRARTPPRGPDRSLGLGLHITRELVVAHGGAIEVESTPGGATTFRFTLPFD